MTPADWIGRLVELRYAARTKPLTVRIVDVEYAPDDIFTLLPGVSGPDAVWFWAKNA